MTPLNGTSVPTTETPGPELIDEQSAVTIVEVDHSVNLVDTLAAMLAEREADTQREIDRLHDYVDSGLLTEKSAKRIGEAYRWVTAQRYSFDKGRYWAKDAHGYWYTWKKHDIALRLQVKLGLTNTKSEECYSEIAMVLDFIRNVCPLKRTLRELETAAEIGGALKDAEASTKLKLAL